MSPSVGCKTVRRELSPGISLRSSRHRLVVVVVKVLDVLSGDWLEAVLVELGAVECWSCCSLGGGLDEVFESR